MILYQSKSYYPKNFPIHLESSLLHLLDYLQQNIQTLDSSKKLKKHIHLYLKQHYDNLFTSIVPSNWWLNYVLERHRNRFSPSFVRQIKPFLTKTKTRSLSGIVPLSLFTKGVGCPFNCAYCPTEPGMPKSYLSDEPAVMRAVRNGFNPGKQTESRLIMLYLSNHPIDKVEIIIKGGTFSFYTRRYRTKFISAVFAACNSNIKNSVASGKTPATKILSLQTEQNTNENAKSRIVGINIETRPDYLDRSELGFLRKLGVTHVEIGVQILNDEMYRMIHRGHTVQSVVNATRLLKDAGFKVGYHLMLNLPGSNPQKDLKLLKLAFENTDFRPDHLKLYPTAITPYTDIKKWYENGTYRPYPLHEMSNVIAVFKSESIPVWTRIGRLTRDITSTMMEHNPFPPNLREIVQKTMKEKNMHCRCIRCREIKNHTVTGKPQLRIISYRASQGTEFFLEYIDKKEHSLGFLRLRLPSYLFDKKEKPLYSCLKNSAIIRELHIYGQATEIGARNKKHIQHRDLGKKLLMQAEKIARANRIHKIAVIAGIGTRPYYRKFGFSLHQTYMVKSLTLEVKRA